MKLLHRFVLWGFIAAGSFYTGCANTNNVTKLTSTQSIDEVRQSRLTLEAYEKVKDIEIVRGYVLKNYNGYAVGANFFSRIGSFFTGNGLGRKTILSLKKDFDEGTLIHEDLHHLDSKGMIDHSDWQEAYDRLRQEKSEYYLNLVERVERRVGSYEPVYWIFGVSKTSELLAHLGVEIANGALCPDYMKDVYRKIFRDP